MNECLQPLRHSSMLQQQLGGERHALGDVVGECLRPSLQQRRLNSAVPRHRTVFGVLLKSSALRDRVRNLGRQRQAEKLCDVQEPAGRLFEKVVHPKQQHLLLPGLGQAHHEQHPLHPQKHHTLCNRQRLECVRACLVCLEQLRLHSEAVVQVAGKQILRTRKAHRQVCSETAVHEDRTSSRSGLQRRPHEAQSDGRSLHEHRLAVVISPRQHR
mmetsp:Transcript_21582/g.56994  ORF Transcript_21582/g.56994 Transcript_21582/m.56994 type:complete len:214 (+) Transcript_21582:239-880(+)